MQIAPESLSRAINGNPQLSTIQSIASNLNVEVADLFNNSLDQNDLTAIVVFRGKTLVTDNIHYLIDFASEIKESLLSEKISFNQIVYPFVEESKLAKSISNDTANGGLISDDSFKSPDGTPREEERKHYKNKLIQIVLGVNGEMLSLICDKTPFVIASFLFAKMEYFNDCLNRSSFDDNVKGACFKDFCKAFRLELWPERFGSSSEAVVVRELTRSLNEISKLIDQLNKLQ